MKELALLFLLTSSSCSLLKRQGDWGKHALWPIKGERVLHALTKNATSAHVLAPLIGAGAIHWGGYDHKISNWAEDEKVIFEDQTAADNWSDNFNHILLYEMYVSTLFTPSMDKDESWFKYLISKGRGSMVISVADGSSRYAHDRLAEAVHRERPNRRDFRSFPSGHATDAGSRNRIVSKNLEATPMDSGLRTGIKALNTTMAAGTVWARVEGKRHFPSDVLFGYALGSFLSGFVYDAFMNHDPNESITIVPSKDKTYVQYSYNF